MLDTLSRSWALLLGVLLLMVGNGVQASLLGIRGAIEAFSTFEMSLVMSAYFAGFLGGSRFAPDLIARVGHVRVFAALASFISAILILFPVAANPWAWVVLRFLIGFCFSGVYVTAESWLNNAASNEHRGKALSLYMIVQSTGIVLAQGLLLTADPSGFVLFVIPSVLVSIAFAPILLSVAPTPIFGTSKSMSFAHLFQISPLGCVGIFLVGGVYSSMFGMAAVYGTQAGFDVGEISLFVAMIYIGGMVLQYPFGFLSDRMERRQLIVTAAAIGALGAGIGILAGSFPVLLLAAFLIGGMSSPLYSLLLAHTNDYLDPEDMSAASGRLMFITGMGSIGGPLATGWLLEAFGPSGFFAFSAAVLAVLAGYGLYRSTKRPSLSVESTGNYAAIPPTASRVTLEVAQDYYQEGPEAGSGATPEQS
ncbi:MFS transporter [Pseudoruegeria sp. SK021]|uniref:MFS transporter n=1 Tax=Pseudoruegeria sp. SK021 TaxID=1933035 RepID=UPI000A2629B7|nr:MFS transporter [Pseudoruegeria sp. SK021]OSP56230.1 MFS transporter [Pseudoruegeria sp. SK021]